MQQLLLTSGLQSKATAIIAVVLAMASFALHYSIELKLDSLEVFDQYNVVFQADPNERIGAMSHGWGRAGRNIAHPNLSNFTSPFVRAIAAASQLVGITNDTESLRRDIGLLIVPIVTALTTACLFALFIRMGLSVLLATLFAILHLVSFSALIFGSIPDHFAMSAFVITLAFHLLLISASDNKKHWIAWCGLLFVAAGITITNIIIIAVTMLAARWQSGDNRITSTVRIAAVALLVIGATLGTSFAMNIVFRGRQLDAQKTANYATTFIDKSDFTHKAIQFPLSIASTIAPARVALGPPTASFRPDDRYQFMLTLERQPGRSSATSVPGLITMALVIIGIFLSLKRVTRRAAMGLAAAAIISFNWIFHSIWGDEVFLYSQHWFTATLIVMAIAANYEKWRSKSHWVIAAFVIATAINNALLLREIITLLSSTGS